MTIAVTAGKARLIMRLLIGLFIAAHGLVTAAMWVTPPKPDEAPFPTRHWLFADNRQAVVTIAVIAAAAFVLAGIGYIADVDSWAWPALVGVATSTLLMVATFSIWWSAGLLINAAITRLALQTIAE